jgi:hypothetical protein
MRIRVCSVRSTAQLPALPLPRILKLIAILLAADEGPAAPVRKGDLFRPAPGLRKLLPVN